MTEKSVTDVIKKCKSETSIENLIQLYKCLHKLIHKSTKSDIDSKTEVIVEIIQLVSDHLIYGDKKDQAFFETFCEYNFISEFIYLADNTDSQEINLQIVKSFSFLILNLSNKMSLYYIFSNNFINKVISNIHIEKYDEDFISYYVNFLKSLALKIDNTTIQFFFHQNMNSFPLIENALKLYNHPDSMIKNVVRNIFLTICKLNYVPFYDYLYDLPSISYFPFISCKLKDMIIKLNNENNYDKFKAMFEDIVDDIIFLQDIFSLGLRKINYVLINSVFFYCLFPLIFKTIFYENNQQNKQNSNKENINLYICIDILCIFFNYIKDESFINLLFIILFNPKLYRNIIKFVINYPSEPFGYFYDWNKQKKNYENSFKNYICYNYSKNFIKNLIFQKENPFPEVQNLVKKYESVADKNGSACIGDNYYKNIKKDVLSNYNEIELSNIIKQHNDLSIGTGVTCGILNDENSQKITSINQKMDKFFKASINGKNNKLISNNIRSNLLSFLNKNDDNLILLINLLIRLCIYGKNESIINKYLLKESQIIPCYLLSNKNDKLISNNISINNKNEDHEEIIYFNNAYFTKLLSQNINSNLNNTSNYLYDVELIDILLKLLSPSNHLRRITLKIIIDNISRICLRQHPTIKNKKQSIMTEEHKEILKNIYYQYINDILNKFEKNEKLKEISFNIFENEYKEYLKKTNIDKILSNNYLILPDNIKEYDESDINSDLIKIVKENPIELYKIKIFTFILVHDLFFELHDKNNDELIRNKFPLGDKDLPLNEQIMLNDLGAGIENYSCKSKKPNENNKSFIDSKIVIYHNKIYLGNVSSNNNYVRFKDKFLLSNSNAVIDRSEPRVLNLVVVNNHNNNDFKEIELMFNSANETFNVKRNLEENIQNSKSTEKCYFESYFELMGKNKI